jgi:hypothetical protein
VALLHELSQVLAQARHAARAFRDPLGRRCIEQRAAQMRAVLALRAQGLHPHASEYRKRRAAGLRAVSHHVKVGRTRARAVSAPFEPVNKIEWRFSLRDGRNGVASVPLLQAPLASWGQEEKRSSGEASMAKTTQQAVLQTLATTPSAARSPLRLPLLIASAVVILGLTPAVAAPTYITFDPPGSIYTTARSISHGAVAGFFQDNQGRYHGFLRAPDGSMTTIDAAGAVNTYGASVDESARVTGFYATADGTDHGFLRFSDGTFATFDAKGSIGTIPLSISEGRVTGFYNDANYAAHGFVRHANGKIVEFDPPGSVYTNPTTINKHGAVTGFYQDSGGLTHGFIRALDGTLTTFDPPDSTRTAPVSINSDGTVAGFYTDSESNTHGFVRTADGTITTFDAPRSTYTGVAGINERGRIVGQFYDQKINTHGFLRLSSGQIRKFDPPGSAFTTPESIDSGADSGVVTGEYADPNFTFHGFLRIP